MKQNKDLAKLGLLALSWILCLLILPMGRSYVMSWPVTSVLSFVFAWIAWLILNLTATTWMILSRIISKKKHKKFSSSNGILMAVIASAVTFGYLGMLFYCLLYLSYPVYAEAFDTLLKNSWLPGSILGFYFGSTNIIGRLLH